VVGDLQLRQEASLLRRLQPVPKRTAEWQASRAAASLIATSTREPASAVSSSRSASRARSDGVSAGTAVTRIVRGPNSSTSKPSARSRSRWSLAAATCAGSSSTVSGSSSAWLGAARLLLSSRARKRL